jgi:protein-disulfide isomerase/uncharacterized membrane protein
MVNLDNTTADLDRRSGWGILIILFILAGIGFVLSFTQLFAYTGKSALMGSSWLCGSSDVFEYGCSGVFASRYGKLFGIPWPFFGSLYFLSIIVWILLFRRDTLNIFFGLLMAGGALVSIVLLYILIAVLPGICRWCLFIHITNGLMILTAAYGLYRRRRELSFSLFNPLLTKAFLVLFIMIALGAISISYYFYASNLKLQTAYLNMRLDPTYQQCLYYSQKQFRISVRNDDHILGNKNAPVKIVVYKDAQCEFCHKTWNIIYDLYKKVNANGQNNVMVVVRHYPLSNRCNPRVDSNIHPYACPAARAVEAAGVIGGEEAFWKYHQLLHEHQADLDKAPYLQLAKEMGLSESSFTAAMRDPKVLTKIKKDAASLGQMGYRAVPIVFINGRYVDGWQVKGFMEKIVKEELKSKSATAPTTAPATQNSRK